MEVGFPRDCGENTLTPHGWIPRIKNYRIAIAHVDPLVPEVDGYFRKNGICDNENKVIIGQFPNTAS